MTCKTKLRSKNSQEELEKNFFGLTRKEALRKAVFYAKNRDLELCSVFLTK